jgi:hypothetical protein
MNMSENTEEIRCRFCGEPLSDGDVCYGCHDRAIDEAYREGYNEGYKKGLEEGRSEGRDGLLSELERDIYIPEEVRRRLRWRY